MFEEILKSIEIIPVEQGESHVVDTKITEAFKDYPKEIGEFFLDSLESDKITNNVKSSLVILLGRTILSEDSPEWAVKLVEFSLKDPDSSVRNSALSAIEESDNTDFINTLELHLETEGWLAERAKVILRNLCEVNSVVKNAIKETKTSFSGPRDFGPSLIRTI